MKFRRIILLKINFTEKNSHRLRMIMESFVIIPIQITLDSMIMMILATKKISFPMKSFKGWNNLKSFKLFLFKKKLTILLVLQYRPIYLNILKCYDRNILIIPQFWIHLWKIFRRKRPKYFSKNNYFNNHNTRKHTTKNQLVP